MMKEDKEAKPGSHQVSEVSLQSPSTVQSVPSLQRGAELWMHLELPAAEGTRWQEEQLGVGWGSAGRQVSLADLLSNSLPSSICLESHDSCQ